MAIGNAKRFNVFKRDGFQCQYCGRKPPEVILEVDHIIPRSKGGDNDSLNLITACFECNRGKRDKLLQDVPVSRAEIIKIERERARQTKLYNEHLIQIRKELDDDVKIIGLHWFNSIQNEKDAYVFGKARIPSVRTFLRHIPREEILDAVDIAYDRFGAFSSEDNDYKMWKYFCGICWRKIKGGQNG